MMVASSVVVSVKRVVTCFILSTTSSPTPASNELTRENIRVAVFQRKSTMPTFPSHWAGVSGSIEAGEEPWQCAQRELQEETNLVLDDDGGNSNDDDGNQNDAKPTCHFEERGGLYLDVPFKENRKIRVYPFVVRLLNSDSNHNNAFELKGTEHDTFQFISIPELEQLQPAVPGLARAFHHATYGKYLASDAVPDQIWSWASDKVNGASTLAKQAIPLAKKYPKALGYMTMLRPTMVAIVNVLKSMQQLLEQQGQKGGDQVAQSVTKSLDEEVQRSIDLGVEALDVSFRAYQQSCLANYDADDPSTVSKLSPFTIATFSRSSTLLKILQQFLSKNSQTQKDEIGVGTDGKNHIHVICGKSTPGDEGELTAQNLDSMNLADKVECIEDEALHQAIRDQRVHVVVVGADCVLENQIVNKVGTRHLANICQESSTPVLCCTDRWKIWDDTFPPPLEDIFECIPKALFQRVVIPPLLGLQQSDNEN